ncbi:MAG: transporter related protein [Acidimicrobiales bacterium]|nr:transporter related protein [Acidimicrobiales bacterium]
MTTSGTPADAATTSVIRVRDGRFGYGNQTVVSADLEICAGEVVALLGPNGSGKTTLLKGVLGLVDRLGGSVELFGRPIGEFRDRSLIGYVPQRQTAAGPIPVTVQELVRSGRLARTGLLRRRTAIDNATISSAIDAVGLQGKAREPIATLSGGQQRRALVARALAGGAQVLMLDEPLAGVDQENQDALAIALGALVDAGVTIVVVLHELGPLEPLVSRAICLDSGRVLFDGALETAPPTLLHLGHDHDPHGGPAPHRPRSGMKLFP